MLRFTKFVATEAYDEPQGQAKRMMSPLQKARMDKEKADRDADGKLKPKKVDEVLDTPEKMKAYKNKAKMQSDKARNSATAKIVRGKGDISKEKDTIRKREKGLDMADRAGVRHFRKQMGYDKK